MRLGGCQCGAVRYRLAGEAGPLYACHCRECRKQSASAFGLSLAMSRGALSLIQGEPATWTRGTDSGRRLTCYFCETCGTRLWHAGTGDPAAITVKAGSLDAPPDLSGAIHIWTSRKLPGVVIPEGSEQYPEEPPV